MTIFTLVALINISVSISNIVASILLIHCARSVSRSARLVSDAAERQLRNINR